MAIYGKRKLYQQSLFQKIFKILPKSNFIIELQNLLAENESDFSKISQQEILNLENKYKINEDDFLAEKKSLLENYIYFCVQDKQLSNEEKKQLNILCNLLGIDEKYLSQRISEEGKLIYRDKVISVISDNKVTDSEREELNTIQKEFNISNYDKSYIYTVESRKKIQTYIDELIQKRRVSPDDEKTLNNMISDLNVDIPMLDSRLKKFRNFWDIENSELPVINSPINLQKSENLYFMAKVDWYEERTRTTSVSYSGLTSSIRIVKGLSLRAGYIVPTRNTEEYMKLIDSGNVYFTNKRIIFTGERGNKSISLAKILFVTPFADGIEIGKDIGKKPFLKYSDPETMGLYLTRILKDF